MSQPESSVEVFGFQAEVQRLLQLIIHSVYSEREIFLRELISNASDALDRLRFLSLTDQGLLGNDTDLGIRIEVDTEAKTVTVSDNGIGMSREELKENLGTIARSGTFEHLRSLGADAAKDSNLIGKFGIGFYSAFIVAERVVVDSLRAGSDAPAVRWESAGEGEYQLKDSDRTSRGTSVTLHLRKDCEEFLEPLRLQRVVRTYSDHIAFPITLVDKKAESNKQLNRAEALWLRPKRDLSTADYKEFYKHVSHDIHEPITWVHSKIEGKLSYTLLLYVPSRAPFNMWSQNAQHGVRLYVKRVFITEGIKHLLPSYLRFVRGVIDSDDIPLNISRELLQHNRVINEISSEATKKVLSLLSDMAASDDLNYLAFWKEFGEAIKEGMGEDYVNRDTLKTLLRFSSTHAEREEETVSLADYVGRMKEGQKAIYYLVADSFSAAKSSPLLEVFRKKGVEVLLLHRLNDAWLVSHIGDFDGKPLQSVAQAGIALDELSDSGDKQGDDSDKDDSQNDALAPLLRRIEKQLGERVHEVVVSKRLDSSPVCLVAKSGGELRQLLSRQRPSWQSGGIVLELNAKHPLVKRLETVEDETDFGTWAEVLYEEAVLNAGGELEDPTAFVRRLNELLMGLGDAQQVSS